MAVRIWQTPLSKKQNSWGYFLFYVLQRPNVSQWTNYLAWQNYHGLVSLGNAQYMYIIAIIIFGNCSDRWTDADMIGAGRMAVITPISRQFHPSWLILCRKVLLTLVLSSRRVRSKLSSVDFLFLLTWLYFLESSLWLLGSGGARSKFGWHSVSAKRDSSALSKLGVIDHIFFLLLVSFPQVNGAFMLSWR